MNKKCLYYCSECNAFFSGESSVLTQRCDNCNSVLFVAHDDYEAYSAMSTAEKGRFQQDYIRSRFPKNAQPSHPSVSSVPDLPESTWVSILRAAGWFGVIVCILLGIVVIFSTAASSPLLGLIAGVLVALAGVVAVSFSMVFCTMANDLRAIRNQLNSITHR